MDQNGMSKKYQSNGDKSKGMERHENVDTSQPNVAYEQKKITHTHTLTKEISFPGT